MLNIKKILFISFTLQFLTKCRTKNYCDADFCNNSKQHTLCKYMSEEPASTCVSYERTVSTSIDRQQILDKLNSRRNKIAAGEIRSLPSAAAMMKLEWNMELEHSAQRWADQCVEHMVPDLKDTCRDLGDTQVGQNIATVQGDSPGLTPLALVDVWYMELLKFDSSVVSRYVPSYETGRPHYDYFTQLVWQESTEVGCGGVKFQESLDDGKHRTIYRLVCNFAPAGNRLNKTVYSCGAPCTACPNDVCDSNYPALCEHKPVHYENIEKDVTLDEAISDKTIISLNNTIKVTNGLAMVETNIGGVSTVPALDESSDKEYLTFDYFPHLNDPMIHKESITSIPEYITGKELLLNDFIELLKKKLTNDAIIKNLISTATPEISPTDISFTDESVAAIVNRIYSKKILSTTQYTTPADYVNSTLLVDLIEAVIFRNNVQTPPSVANWQDTQTLPIVKPVKVQAELAEVKPNREFTGHYFFPEEDVESTSEITESYYDSSNLAESDVEIEIEQFKIASVTRDFLDDIFESETSTESTTTLNSLSPESIKLHESGRKVMKNFLKRIQEQSHKSQIDE